ncbi:MAG TPA: hypothetical protein DDY22_02385 [Geobacter sp.]|nr:MAG: hypothetical protein A2076_04160 [Geobacteraceae bacterium GWC2_53_11]HBG04414.1 hypothetical protein [Geobacter sp.]
MRFLIVEDNEAKLSQIMSELIKHNDIVLDIAKSVTSARNLLTRNQYNLVLLDVVLPNFDNEAPKVQHGLDLLREIHEADYIKTPNYIVGLTGFLEVATETKQLFEDLMWTLVHYETENNQWRKTLENIVLHILKSAKDSIEAGEQTDLCIVTALKDPEYTAVMRLPWNWQPPEPLDSQNFIRRGVISIQGSNYSVVAAHANRMGMVASALLSSELIRKFRPKVIGMVGICAGRKEKVQLCDVIVSTETWDWQSGKYVVSDAGNSFQIEPDFIKCSESLRAKIDLLDLSDKVKIFFPDGHSTGAVNMPGIWSGPMATGSAVISDTTIIDKILKQKRSTIAIDMECYGMYSAAYRSSAPQPEFICIKAVSDFGDEHKVDDVQEKCSKYSAETFRYVIEKHASVIFN